MERKNILFLGGLLCLLFSSCSNTVVGDVAEEGDEETVTKTVSLVINEEKDALKQSPRTRGDSDGKRIYGINVYKQGDAGYQHFAYGLFNSTDNMKLLLEEGQKYKLECVEVIDDKEALYHDGDKYYQPFRQRGEPGEITNQFVNSTSTYNSEMTAGVVRVGAEEKDTLNYPRLYTLYGAVENFDPETSSTATLSLTRAVVGIHFKITPPKHGSVRFWLFNGEHTFYVNSGDEPIDDKSVYSFRQIVNGSKGEYGGDVPVTIIWTFEDGTTKSEEINVPVTRNTMTNVNIDFTNLAPSSVTFSEESGELGEGQTLNFTIGK